jgi:predicted DNA-binding transcriptional regulator AlpA
MSSRTPHQFLRIGDVARLTALSKSYIYALQAKGLFPKSIQIAPKVSVWTEASIREWQDRQLNASMGMTG